MFRNLQVPSACWENISRVRDAGLPGETDYSASRYTAPMATTIPVIMIGLGMTM